MSASSNEPFQPGTYVKGDQSRYCQTAKDAVQATFDGFTRQVTEADVAGGFAADNDAEAARKPGDGEETDYRDLQAQAKELGIPANQSAEALKDAIAANEQPSQMATPDGEGGVPVDDSDPSRSHS